MPSPELAQLEMLAQVDELIDRLTRWAEPESSWDAMRYCRALVRRLLWRVETLRVRLEAPLIVATFGGTGTGKSALVNALVGRECTPSGRQRPTTTQPVLITHPQTELELLGLPLEDFTIVRADGELLRDIVLIDCPDPDTSEVETHDSNLARLHQLLPYCDVLIYASTQQKYRSARVADELLQAATGCRLVFVQTHADVDEDIRADWRRQLEHHYQVPDMFFVDSLRALREEQAGQRPSGDFHRLQELLTTQLAASYRTQIRRANLIDLVQNALDHCRDHISAHWTTLSQLETALDEQLRKLNSTLSDRLRDELLASSHLWERRLLSSVTQNWGFSPFSSVLRIYNGLGTWIASAGMLRARNSAQVALIGAMQGVRWLQSRQQEQDADSQLDRMAAFGLDDALLRESQLVVTGYVQEARLDSRLLEGSNVEGLRHLAVRVEDQFLGDASRRVNAIIEQLASRHSGWAIRCLFEFLLGVLVLYMIGWPAYSFFVAHPWFGAPLIPVDFYVHAAVFLVLWSAFLVMLFNRRLRSGLKDEIRNLANHLAQSRLASGLFPQLEASCREIRVQRERLEAMVEATRELRRQVAGATALGARAASERTPDQDVPVGKLRHTVRTG